MKIKDIILEAPANYNSTAYNNSPLWNNVGPSSKSPNGSVIPVAASGGSTAPAATSTARTPKTGSDKAMQSGRIVLKRVDRFLARGRYAPYIKSKKIGYRAAGRVLRLWTLVGFGLLIDDYYDKKSALAIMRELPPTDEDHMSEEDYTKGSRLALEALAVSIVASQGFVRLLQMLKIGKWLTTLAGAFGSAASFGTGFAIFLASEVAMFKFQQWLMTDDGRKAVSWVVAWCVDPIAGDLFGFIEPFTGKIGELIGWAKKSNPNPDSKKPDDKKTDPNQAAQPTPQGQTDTTIPTANVPPSYVGNPNDLMKRDAPKEKLAMNF